MRADYISTIWKGHGFSQALTKRCEQRDNVRGSETCSVLRFDVRFQECMLTSGVYKKVEKELCHLPVTIRGGLAGTTLSYPCCVLLCGLDVTGI